MGIFGQKAKQIVESLNERAIANIDGLGKIGFYENETRNNGGEAAYFKVITKEGEARIKFSEPDYVVHKGKSVVLDKGQKKKLMTALSEKDEEGKTNWDKLNDEYEIMSKEKSTFRNNIPDYTKLPNKIKKK